MKSITFIDTEISNETKKITDYGAIKENGESLHGSTLAQFISFVKGTDFLCGHNIIRHDLSYLRNSLQGTGSDLLPGNQKVIDTLFWSPLMFPQRPYHKLVKDDKLQTGELNNPLNDAIKARDLFYDEDAAFRVLPHPLKRIYYALLGAADGYAAFFQYQNFTEAVPAVETEISGFFWGQFCMNVNIGEIARAYPIALAYALAIIYAAGEDSITPRWVLHQYPETDTVLHRLRETPCQCGCDYCRERLDAVKALKRFFGYDSYRKFDGASLQEEAVKAAIQNRSLLAVFPTGGGKSITIECGLIYR